MSRLGVFRQRFLENDAVTGNHQERPMNRPNELDRQLPLHDYGSALQSAVSWLGVATCWPRQSSLVSTTAMRIPVLQRYAAGTHAPLASRCGP